MIKNCCRCKKDFPIESFCWRVKDIKRGSYCLDCMRRYRREHYYNNPNAYIKRAKENRDIRREWLKNEKNKPCMDCDQVYPPYVMDFHHRDPSQKSFEVGELVAFSLKRMKIEIEKCDLICANCHRIRTFRDDS